MLRRAKGFDLDYYDDYELPERRFAPSGRRWPPWISYSSERVSKVSSAPRSMSGSMWCASPMPQDRMKEDCADGTTSSEEARRYRRCRALDRLPAADNVVDLFVAGMTPQRGGHSAHARRGRPRLWSIKNRKRQASPRSITTDWPARARRGLDSSSAHPLPTSPAPQCSSQ